MPDGHLFERPMILLDLLVLVMELEKGRTINSVPPSSFDGYRV